MKILISWNVTSPFDSIAYDCKFVQLLLANIVDATALAENRIPLKQKAFVKGNFLNYEEK